MRVSIIVPVLDEAATIATTLAGLRDDFPGCELLVADGGSTDRTPEVAAPLARVLPCGPGRARQMNAGAAAASGDVLWFVHADTRPEPVALPQLRAALADPAVLAGGCRVRFDADTPGLRYLAWASNLRAGRLGQIFGDQAMFVRREVFCELGGYPELALMEDLALARLLRRRGRLVLLPAAVTASARRFTRHGTARMIAFMQYLRLRYVLGTDPELLAARYAAGPGLRMRRRRRRKG
jgi:rSAM/selenodomain-associated transferase 2